MLHPSFSIILPSSQSSPGSMTWFPQLEHSRSGERSRQSQETPLKGRVLAQKHWEEERVRPGKQEVQKEAPPEQVAQKGLQA